MRVAAVQLQAGLDKQGNLEKAVRMVKQATVQGVDLVVLPEMFSLYGDLASAADQAEPIPGPTSDLLCDLARQEQVTLCGGSFAEKGPESGKAYNTSLLISSQGEIISQYRKVHRFDVQLPGQVTAQESAHFLAGEDAPVVTHQEVRIGTAICYDLRFPELFRKQVEQGMQLLLLPSAFTKVTGRDHWHVLVRARAIENQVYVIAANQVGEYTASSSSFGHSLIVDPWGNILAEGDGEREEILFADLDFSAQTQIRQRLPALTHRKIR